MEQKEELLPEQLENCPDGEAPSSEYNVDADNLMKNLNVAIQVGGVRFIDGADCEDDGSDDTHCRLIVKSNYGTSGLVDVNQPVYIYDGAGNLWYVTAFADNKVRFTPDDRLDGTKTNGYNDAGFIDNLKMIVFRIPLKISSENICLAKEFSNALTGEKIARSSTSDDTIDDVLTSHEDRMDASLNADGTLKTGVVSMEQFADDSLVNEGFVNLCKFGGFNIDDDNDGLANGWVKISAVANDVPSLDSTYKTEGAYSQKMVVASELGNGILYAFDNDTIDMMKGRTISVSTKCRPAGAYNVKIKIDDGVGESVSTITTPANQWTDVYVTRTVDSNATKLEVHIYIEEPGTFYVDECMVCQGDNAKLYAVHTLETQPLYYEENLIRNPLFIDVHSQADEPIPDCWYGTVSGSSFVADNNAIWGNKVWHLILENNDYVRMYIPYELVRINEKYTFSLYIKDNGSTDPIEIGIYDGHNWHWREYDISSGFDSYKRIAITKTNVNGGMLVGIRNNAGTLNNADFYINAPTLNWGEYPASPNINSPYEQMQLVFSQAGSLSNQQYLLGAGGYGGGYPIGRKASPRYATAILGACPNTMHFRIPDIVNEIFSVQCTNISVTSNSNEQIGFQELTYLWSVQADLGLGTYEDARVIIVFDVI